MKNDFPDYPIINLDKTGQRIKRFRVENGISVHQIREYLGNVSKQSVSNWECSKSLPSLDNLLALSVLYGVSINDIIVYDFLRKGD